MNVGFGKLKEIVTRQETYVQRDTEAHSHNHSCNRKVVPITDFGVSVCILAFVIQHAKCTII